MKKDQVGLELARRTIVLSSYLSKINLLPERLTVNRHLPVDCLNTYFRSLYGSWVNQLVVVVRIEMKLLFWATKLVDTLIDRNLVLYFWASKNVDDILKSLCLRASQLLYFLFVELRIVIGIDQKVNNNWLTELAGFPVGGTDHFYF